MAIPEEHKRRYFYHFTHLKNLESICKNGILSTNKKKKLGIEHVNVANSRIQERRENMDVTCKPLGKVHDYVPFYWCTINPMMLSLVNSKNVDQQEVVFLAVPIEKILEPHVIFTNASANTENPPEFFNDVADLNNLDWSAIDLTRWKSKDDDERHKRMSEVLIFEEVPFSYVEFIIAWNPSYKEIIEKGCQKIVEKPPIVVIPPFNSRYFYFTQFPYGKPRHSLVTGPYWLKRQFEETVQKVIKKRKEQKDFSFKNISELLESIDTKFIVLPELGGIFELETINDVHSENVSDHTLKVVERLLESECYKGFEICNKELLKFTAYLHDIGKGPKSKWKDGKQPAYPDHPVDALPMLERILTEEIKQLADSEIRTICLLVAYHDLIGEIIGKGRDIQQLFDIIENETELEMLACLSRADISAMGNPLWMMNYDQSENDIKEEAFKKLREND